MLEPGTDLSMAVVVHVKWFSPTRIRAASGAEMVVRSVHRTIDPAPVCRAIATIAALIAATSSGVQI